MMDGDISVKKVVQFVNSLSVVDGGPARHAYELGRELGFTGIDDTLVTRREVNQLLVFDADGLASGRTRVEFLLDPSIAHLRKTSTLIREADVVVVHGYYLGWLPIAVILARCLRKPVLGVPHGSLNDYEQRKSGAKKLAWRILIGWWLDRLISAFVVTSENERRQVSSRHPTRVLVGGAGVAPAPVAVHVAQQDLSLLVLSRIAPKKRVDISIKALAELRAQGVPAKLTIAGAGDPTLVASLRALVENLGMSAFVEFIGNVDGLAKEVVFAKADVYLAPSDDENFGIAVAEAMTRGVPVVASSAVDCAHEVESPAVKVLYDASPTSVARAVQEVLGQPDLARLRAELAESAAVAFSWERVARQWCLALSEVAQHGR